MLNKLALFVASNIMLAGCFAPEHPLSQDEHGSAGRSAQQAGDPVEAAAAPAGEHFGDLAAWPIASARSTAHPTSARAASNGPARQAAATTNLPQR